VGILSAPFYHPEMIESPQGFVATVLGVAALFPTLAARWQPRLFAILPPIVLAYAVTMLLAVAGLWKQSAAVEATRGRLLAVLVPTLVFLLLVPCDLRAVARVGPRLLLAFTVATLTILIGFVAAWLLWRQHLPANAWQVLAAVAGGWVGGTANLVAVANGLEAPADAVGLAVVTDTVCYFCWILALFSAAPAAVVFNHWSGGQPAGSIEEKEPESSAVPGIASRRGSTSSTAACGDRQPRNPSAFSGGAHVGRNCPPSPAGQGSLFSLAARFIPLLAWLGAGLVVSQVAAFVAWQLPAGGPLSTSSWTTLMATLAGVTVAQTPLRRIPGSALMASAVLFVVVVTMATQATLAGLTAAPVFVAAGFTVLVVHALGMAVAARVLRLDLASCSVASLANIGGVASAPLMAALHAPALTPVAVLLALLGYLVGLPAGLALAAVLQRVGPGLMPAALVVLGCSGGIATANEVVTDRRMAEFWVSQCPDADRVLLDLKGATAFTARLLDLDPTLRDLAQLPEHLPRADVLTLIARSTPSPSPLYHADGTAVTTAEREAWQAARALEKVPAEVRPRFGLIVRRTAVRTLPTAERALKTPRDSDLDRLQETGLFPGTPVAVLHPSADTRWVFMLAPTYVGWVAADAIALGSREEVLGYVARASRVITGSQAVTVFTPELPAVSRLVLDMGVTLPERSDWPRREPVNGQVPLAAHVIELPTRAADGSLVITPALLPLAADSHAGPLPVTRANLIRQAGKFLGERYGWGHDYDSRDCSGFVGEVYRSLGIQLPRNTADHVASPALVQQRLAPDLGRRDRLTAIARLAPGDLIYAPRHVMMVIGHAPDTWVIHATHGGWDGPPVNGIVIMPLAEVGTKNGPIVDTITTLIQVLPR
jgi:uncharacterized membrane protein/cell wall-associated NlpC family hydrolase